MLNVKLRYPTFLMTMLMISTAGFAGDIPTKTLECKISFAFDKADVDAEEIRTCFEDVGTHDIEYFNIYTAASFEGSIPYNQKLSEKRAANITETLAELFPGKKTHAIEGGENVRGRVGLITAFLVDQTPVATIKNLEEHISSWKKNRVASQFIYNKYFFTDTWYESLGIEYARLTDVYADHFFGEFGLGVHYYADDHTLDLWSVDPFVGGYVKSDDNIAAGLRGTVSYLSRTDGEESALDLGSEMRIGYDGDKFSTYGVFGISKKMRSMGLEVGMRL